MDVVTASNEQPAVTPGPPRLRRSRDDKIIAGVCGGLGKYFGIDPVWFRLAFVVLAIGGGSGILVYLVAALIIPREDGTEPAVPRSTQPSGVIIGLILITVGTIALVNAFVPWVNRVIWPLVIVAIGVALITGGRRRDADR
jgi:phage shock protein C